MSVWASVIAVVGTLAGVAVTAWWQARAARVHRREARQEARRGEALTALTALVAALSEHRRATWVERRAFLAGENRRVVAEATLAARETWSRTATALATVKVVAPEFTPDTEAVTDAIWEMSTAETTAVLEQRRQDAASALDRLQTKANETYGGAR